MQNDNKKQRADLFQAIRRDNFRLFKIILNNNPSLINARNDDKIPILLLAMESNNHLAVKYLMEHGVNLAARDPLNRNLFHIGAYFNSVQSMIIVRQILRSNLSPSDCDCISKVRELLTGQSVDLNTPLHFAVRHKSSAMLKLILKMLFDYCSNEDELLSALTKTNYNLHTVLHTAIEKLSTKCVKLLLKTKRFRKLLKNSRVAQIQKVSIVNKDVHSSMKELATRPDCTGNNIAFVLCTISRSDDQRIIQILDLLHKYCDDALRWTNKDNMSLAEYANENESVELLTHLVELGYTKN